MNPKEAHVILTMLVYQFSIHLDKQKKIYVHLLIFTFLSIKTLMKNII